MKYTLPDEASELVLYQRTELLPPMPKISGIRKTLEKLGLVKDRLSKHVKNVAKNDKTKIEEAYFCAMEEKAKTLLPHLPPSTKSILDIGCGIAGLDLFLYNKLTRPTLILLDKTEKSQRIWYGFERTGAFYNSLEVAQQMLVENGVNPSHITPIFAPSNGVIPLARKSVDVILSTISWGFHYPVDIYIKSVCQILKTEGVLIVDVRCNTDGKKKLSEHFDIEILNRTTKYHTLKCMFKV